MVNEIEVERIVTTTDSARETSVLAIRLNTPQRRNALSLYGVERLRDVLEEHHDETMVIGSVTSGIFSAGADLHACDSDRARISDILYECYELMTNRAGAIICAVDGPAVGGGAQLTTACDVRIMSSAARWRWVGPGHGLAVGAWILPELLGRSRGFDLALSGRWLDADEAQSCGFAVLAKDPWQEALRYAAELTTAEPTAVARVRRIATYPHIKQALRAERQENRSSWSGSAPSAEDAARASKGLDDSE